MGHGLIFPSRVIYCCQAIGLSNVIPRDVITLTYTVFTIHVRGAREGNAFSSSVRLSTVNRLFLSRTERRVA